MIVLQRSRATSPGSGIRLPFRQSQTPLPGMQPVNYDSLRKRLSGGMRSIANLVVEPEAALFTIWC